MNVTYCDKQCKIGITARNKFLDEQNSAYDAALDFLAFTEKCFKTCPYKDAHVDLPTA